MGFIHYPQCIPYLKIPLKNSRYPCKIILAYSRTMDKTLIIHLHFINHQLFKPSAKLKAQALFCGYAVNREVERKDGIAQIVLTLLVGKERNHENSRSDKTL
jgi:hypothetical protein